MLLCAQRTASYHAAAPFFVRPCCRCLDSSPVPLVPFASVAFKEKTGAAQEEEKEKREWKWEKVASWRERERILYEYIKTQLLSPLSLPPSPAPLLTSQRFRRVFTPALLPLSLLSSPFPFLESASLFFLSLLVLSPPPSPPHYLVSRIYVEFVCFLYAARVSPADFMLECSHLKSVFSCRSVSAHAAKNFFSKIFRDFLKNREFLISFFHLD